MGRQLCGWDVNGASQCHSGWLFDQRAGKASHGPLVEGVGRVDLLGQAVRERGVLLVGVRHLRLRSEHHRAPAQPARLWFVLCTRGWVGGWVGTEDACAYTAPHTHRQARTYLEAGKVVQQGALLLLRRQRRVLEAEQPRSVEHAQPVAAALLLPLLLLGGDARRGEAQLVGQQVGLLRLAVGMITRARVSTD